MNRDAPTELLLVRHGESQSSRSGTVGGPLGCRGLTAHGRRQTGRLARRLRAEHARRPLDALYAASHLTRVQQSARLVSAALGLDVVTEPGLREADMGAADGRPWREVVAAFGGAPALRPERPLAPGAESWGAYLRRVRAALDRLLERHAGQRVLVVGHGETVAAVSQILLRLPADVRAHTAFVSHPTGLTHWARRPLPWPPVPGSALGWALLCHNDTSHLPADHLPAEPAVSATS
ncbi:histidine phosphatase family protein [Streptomyces caatingaensis]|uniref:Phosphoglycerate mutase n=1 Tax=Streptomyces caatingaensis TaxID=1678637 RepID=A0A0K9XBR2_9ACTN|nr:histidine phosphatase family protein [Streptomyces caatingaensis]KNB50850.1 hypothetical protein AC230_20740 [Streptomyces caatingaensis]